MWKNFDEQLFQFNVKLKAELRKTHSSFIAHFILMSKEIFLHF